MRQSSTARNLRAVRRQLEKPPSTSPKRLRLLLAILAGAVLLGAGSLWYADRAARPEVAEVRSGTVELLVDADAVVVRKEKVYSAPVGGRLRRLMEEGQRVRVGAPVAQILPGTAAAAPATPAAQQSQGQQPPPAPAAQQPATKQPATTPATAPAPAPQRPAAGQSAVRREIDELAARIYVAALAWNTARDQGDAAGMERFQAELDTLGARQAALAGQLGRDEAPLVTPAPALPAPVATAPAPAPTTTPTTPAPPTTLAQVGPGGREIVVDAAGVLVYQTDGLESVLNPARPGEWKPGWLRALTGEPRKTGDTVAAGEPLFKVVDNLSLSLLAVVPADILRGIGPDHRVMLRFADREGPPVVARIARREQEGNEVLLVLTAPVFPEELTWNRKVKVSLVFGSYSGLVVPRTAIDVRDGRQGVWVMDGSHESFRPVRVLGGNDTEVALEGELAPGLQVRREAPTRMR